MIPARAAAVPRVGGDMALTALLVVLAHAALLVAWRQQARPQDHEPPRILVRLLPLPAIGEPPRTGSAAPPARRPAAARPARPPAVASPAGTGDRQPVSPPPGEPVLDEGTSKRPVPQLGDAARAAAIAPPSLAERARALGPATSDTALERGVAAAARPDCKDAYSGLVLLAIPRLVIDTVRDRGCRWK